MNREVLQVLLDQMQETRARLEVLLIKMGHLMVEVREELEKPDETPPASARKTGRGSLLILPNKPAVDDLTHARAGAGVARLKRTRRRR